MKALLSGIRPSIGARFPDDDRVSRADKFSNLYHESLGHNRQNPIVSTWPSIRVRQGRELREVDPFVNGSVERVPND
jgi:hypothetical protein